MKSGNSGTNNNSESPLKHGAQNIYTVPRDFDKTSTTLLPLDHYLTNKDVYALVQTLFSDTRNWSQWAMQHPFDSCCYFSPPYTCREAYLLGYGSDEDNNNLDNNEHQTL